MTAELLTIRTCIACGAMEAPRPCTGACDDRRLELVDRDAHDEALATLERARGRVAALTRLAERIIAAPADGADAAAVRREAREFLRAAEHDAGPGDLEPAAYVTAWWCAGCGRIEAPQPCLGVCVRRPVDYVRAHEHARALAAIEEARRTEVDLTAMARQAAWVMPRPGHAAETWTALRERAAGCARPHA